MEKMKIEEIVRYWIACAEDDWKAIEGLLKNENYSYVLFFGHLYLEKLLKALVVKETKIHAQPTHNLRLLAEKANLSLLDEQLGFVLRVNEYNIKARYPDFKFEFKQQCTKEFALEEIEKIGEFGKWLIKKL